MRRVITLTAVFLGTGALAMADVPPATAPRAQPTAPTSTPYWNPQSPSDLPAADIRTVPAAHANAVRAAGTFQQTLFDLNNAVRLVRMQMDRDPDFVKAVAEEKAAYDDLNKARSDALANLQGNSAYSGAAALHQNVSTQIADEQFAPKPDETRLTAMARLKLQYIRDNRKLESATLERDQPYQDARKRYLDAATKVAHYRDAQSIALAQDGGLADLRKRVGEARIDKTAAKTFWIDSVDAREIALDYAYYYRGVDARFPYSPYGLGGYGLGGGYGNYGYRY